MNNNTNSMSFKVLTVLIISFAFVLGTVSIVAGDEITDKQSIKIIQATLNAEGFECGTADGIAGKKTKAAVEEYQRKNGMAVTGIITDELTDSLGLTADTLKGVLISDFVAKYNEGVLYCNAISDQTGDPDISQIDISIFEKQSAVLDGNASVSFLVDERKLSIKGVILYKEGNSYNIPMVYELISCVYALDTSFYDMATVIDFVGDFVETHDATTGRMTYSIVTRGGTILFAVVPAA